MKQEFKGKLVEYPDNLSQRGTYITDLAVVFSTVGEFCKAEVALQLMFPIHC